LLGLLGFGAAGFDTGAEVDGVDGVEGVEFWVDGVLGVALLVDGDEAVELVFFAAFFLWWTAFGADARPGTVPAAAGTAVMAAGVATLIMVAFVPGPAVAVLLPPPELAMPNAAAKAAITAMRPMAIVRGSMVLGSTFSGFRRFVACVGRDGKARSG
jgi:hypothetical protein